MKIHHLNCGSMCPIGGKILPRHFAKEIVCHCWLIETPNRLVMVDTGLGTREFANPWRLGAMALLLGVQKKPELAAVEQIKKLGFSPEDVTDIIPTHLDFDHAGGIADFPWARVHVSKAELKASRNRFNLKTRERYRPNIIGGDVKWMEFDLTTGERWYEFDVVREVNGLPPEILLVRLPGHTAGHYGVAVSKADGWMLHAGDAYYDHREIQGNAKASPDLLAFQKIVHVDLDEAKETQRKIRRLGSGVRVMCSHDPTEFQTVQKA